MSVVIDDVGDQAPPGRMPSVPAEMGLSQRGFDFASFVGDWYCRQEEKLANGVCGVGQAPEGATR